MTLVKDGWLVWMVVDGKAVEGSDEFAKKSSEQTGFCSLLSISRSYVGETASTAGELAFVVGCALGSCVKRGISV